MSEFSQGVMNVWGDECRGDECRTIVKTGHQNQIPQFILLVSLFLNASNEWQSSVGVFVPCKSTPEGEIKAHSGWKEHLELNLKLKPETRIPGHQGKAKWGSVKCCSQPEFGRLWTRMQYVDTWKRWEEHLNFALNFMGKGRGWRCRSNLSQKRECIECVFLSPR